MKLSASDPPQKISHGHANYIEDEVIHIATAEASHILDRLYHRDQQYRSKKCFEKATEFPPEIG